MGLSFSKRVKVLPGITLNFSKSGVSMSVGPRGAKVNLNRRGVDFRGSGPVGLRYRERVHTWAAPVPHAVLLHPGGALAKAQAAPPHARRADQVRHQAPQQDRPFVDACLSLVAGRPDEACRFFLQAPAIGDAAFAAGLLLASAGQFEHAAHQLGHAAAYGTRLGEFFAYYEFTPEFSVPVTPELAVQVDASWRSCVLALVECQQALGQAQAAVHWIQALRESSPIDRVAKLSLAELLVRHWPGEHAVCDGVATMFGDVENSDAIGATMLLYKALALRGLGMRDAAEHTLTLALRRQKDRPRALLSALGYERAVLLEEQGAVSRARSEFERIYAEDPEYRDVKERARSTAG